MAALNDPRYIVAQLGDGVPPPIANARPATPEEREAILRRLRARMRGATDFRGALNSAVTGGYLHG